MPAIYYKSDFAINKDKDSIVYKSVTGEVIEVTAIDYLRRNPDKTFNDFLELKKFSDDNYHVEMLLDKKEIRNTTYIEDVNENRLMDNSCNPQELMCSVQDKILFYQNISDFINHSKVTETELRRFKLLYSQNLSYVEIAQTEGTSISSICQSITNFRKKAKKFLKTP